MAITSGLGTTVGSAIAPGIGTAIGSVLDVLGGFIKGVTKHYSASQVEPLAANFASYMLPRYQAMFAEVDIAGISNKFYNVLRQAFINATDVWWGRNSPGAQIFYANLGAVDAKHGKSPNDSSVYGQWLHDYVMFVLMNVDADSGEDEKQKYLNSIYDAIFTNSMLTVGLDPNLTGGKAAAQTPTGTKVGEDKDIGLAGFSGDIIFVIIIAGLALALFAGKKGGKK